MSDFEPDFSACADRAFAALEVDLGQLDAICPGAEQKRQSLLSILHCCSSGVSFPSFPSLFNRSGFLRWLDDDDELAEFDELPELFFNDPELQFR